MATWQEKLGFSVSTAEARSGTMFLAGSVLTTAGGLGIIPAGDFNPSLTVGGLGLSLGAYIFRELAKGQDNDGNFKSSFLRSTGQNTNQLLQTAFASLSVANVALVKFGVDIGNSPAQIWENLTSGKVNEAFANPAVANSLYFLVNSFSLFLTTPLAKNVPEVLKKNMPKIHAATSTVAGCLLGVLGHRIDSPSLMLIGGFFAGEALERYGAMRSLRHGFEDVYSLLIGENQAKLAFRDAQRRADPAR